MPPGACRSKWRWHARTVLAERRYPCPKPWCLELRLRLCYIGLWSGAALEAIDGELQSILIGFHGVVEKLFLSICASQFEIVVCQLGMQTQVDSCQISRRCLGFFARRRNSSAHAPPNVQFVRNIER